MFFYFLFTTVTIVFFWYLSSHYTIAPELGIGCNSPQYSTYTVEWYKVNIKVLILLQLFSTMDQPNKSMLKANMLFFQKAIFTAKTQ